jgi:hypothetical protein
MQVQQELERYRSDALYLEEHRRELLKQYPDRWLAVYDQHVVGASKDIKRLVAQLQRKGIPASHTVVRYLTDKDELLIL